MEAARALSAETRGKREFREKETREEALMAKTSVKIAIDLMIVVAGRQIPSMEVMAAYLVVAL